MATAFEYKGVREANKWTFGYHDQVEWNGEVVAHHRDVRASLSENSAEQLSNALKGGGPAREAQEIAIAIGVILNSLSLGGERVFEIPDGEVDKYLAGFSS
jgi:hypothetical protein